ncbi:MAG TPA: hypothetical protein VGB02_11840 [Pyrinomonadaceae bacterium]|jgi:hypothetical protein
MQKKLMTMFVFLATVFTVLAFNSAEAAAQRRTRGADKYAIDQTIRRVETNADAFVAAINDSLDRSRLEDTKLEDRINERARELGDATDKLRREFDRGDSLAENKQYVRNCLNIARTINGIVRRRNFGAKTEGIWAQVRRDLNSLARAYGLSGV